MTPPGTPAGTPARAIVEGGSLPRLPRHVKMRFDKARDRWVVLAPERVLMPDETALEVLQRCDGETSVNAIVAVSPVTVAPSKKPLDGNATARSPLPATRNGNWKAAPTRTRR